MKEPKLDQDFEAIANIAAALLIAMRAEGPEESRADCVQTATALLFAMGSTYVLKSFRNSVKNAESKRDLLDEIDLNVERLKQACHRDLKQLTNRLEALSFRRPR